MGRKRKHDWLLIVPRIKDAWKEGQSWRELLEAYNKSLLKNPDHNLQPLKLSEIQKIGVILGLKTIIKRRTKKEIKQLRVAQDTFSAS